MNHIKNIKPILLLIIVFLCSTYALSMDSDTTKNERPKNYEENSWKALEKCLKPGSTVL